MSKRKADKEGSSVAEKIPGSDKDTLRSGSFETTFRYSDHHVSSSSHYVGNIPWRLTFRPDIGSSSNKLQVNVDLSCNRDNISPLWKVESNFTIRLVSQSQSVDDMEKNGNFCFDSKNTVWSTSYEGSYEAINAKFVKDSKIKFIVSIKIKNVVGIECYETNFSKPTSMTDVVLVVEGKKIHVNKSFLAVHSSVFEAMFFSGFKEENQKEVEMKDVDYGELVDLLTFIHPGADVPIHENNLEYLLELADRFDIKKVVHLCTKFLMTTQKVSNSRKFVIADKYSLSELHSEVLRELSVDDFTVVRNVKEFSQFKTASKDALIDALIVTLKNCKCQN